MRRKLKGAEKTLAREERAAGDAFRLIENVAQRELERLQTTAQAAKNELARDNELKRELERGRDAALTWRDDEMAPISPYLIKRAELRARGQATAAWAFAILAGAC